MSAGPRRQVGESFGDGLGSNELCPHRRDTGDVALSAPIDQSRDELVELRRAED